MQAGDGETERRVRRAVERATGRPAAGLPVRRLAGHASLRSYWRVGTRPASWPPRDGDGIELPPATFGFVVVPDAAPEACR